MSSFVVSNETINRVVHLLNRDACGCPKHPGSQYCDDLGNRLWQLNQDATYHRYRKPAELLLERYRWSPRNYTKFEMLKAGQCWLYQTNEDDKFANTLLFVEVKKAVRAMLGHIVDQLPEYEQVPWDAPHNAKLVATAQPSPVRVV